MEIQKQKIINIAFLDDETNIIQSIIAKLVKESSKPGFTKTYNKEERELINKINDEINDTLPIQQISIQGCS